MSNICTFEVEMEAEVKERVEQLYETLGLPFADAIRVFAYQSLLMRGMPFPITLKTRKAWLNLSRFFTPIGDDDVETWTALYRQQLLEDLLLPSITEASYKSYVESSKEFGCTQSEAMEKVARKFGISQALAGEMVGKYWG